MALMERRFRTRGYELDRTGRINVAQFARYLEHLRWEAMADPAARLGRLFSGGNHMVVRAQVVEVLAETRHDCDLVATLDVTRVGRSSLDIGHRVTRAADDVEVARGTITGVFIDETDTPQAIPDDVRMLAPAPAPASAAATAPAPESAPTFETSIVVRPSDTDLLQHVNHARYIDYFDDALAITARADSLGLYAATPALAITHFQISYDEQAVLGDTLALRLAKTAGAPLTFDGSLYRVADNRRLARARLVLTRTDSA